jgi:hypothetical protein
MLTTHHEVAHVRATAAPEKPFSAVAAVAEVRALEAIFPVFIDPRHSSFRGGGYQPTPTSDRDRSGTGPRRGCGSLGDETHEKNSKQ